MADDNQQGPYLVQAIFSFKGKNNDELCFKKGDIITLTQLDEGGWWEGTLGDKTGWFPSNYVKEYKTQADNLSAVKLSPVSFTSQQAINRAVVLKDLIDSEQAYVAELQALFSNFLLPLENSKIMTPDEYKQLVGNIAEIVKTHQELLATLEECASRPSSDQRVGKVFLNSAPHLKQVHMTYCSGHPKAVCILEKYKDDLGQLMESCGAATPGLLVLTTALSKPFRRLEKYCGMLQELGRHVEENHPDRGDILRSVSVYKDIASSCSVTRRQKELELEVLRGGVRGWEGEELASLGEILHMGSVAVGPQHTDRYLLLFQSLLVILSVSHRMSGFIYEGKLPLTGITVNKLEDSDIYKNAFEIIGPMIDKIIAVCQTKEDQQTWVEKIRFHSKNFKKTASPSSHPNSIVRPVPPSRSVSHPPYTRLTKYFARLVIQGVITRALLKNLLYHQFHMKIDTSKVKRRPKKHRTECVIYPQYAVRTWLTSSDDEEEDNDDDSDDDDHRDDDVLRNIGGGCRVIKGCDIFTRQLAVDHFDRSDTESAESYFFVFGAGDGAGNFQHALTPDQNSYLSTESSFDAKKSGYLSTESSFDVQKAGYLSTESSFDVQNQSVAVEDLSRLDEDMELSPSCQLRVQYPTNNFPSRQSVSHLSLPVYSYGSSSSCANSHKSHSVSLNISVGFDLPTSSVSESVINDQSTKTCSSSDRIHHNSVDLSVSDESFKKQSKPSQNNVKTINNSQGLHRSYSYQLICPSSIRSSDSGLADVTTPDIVLPTIGRDFVEPRVESETSSSFEMQCVCTSPFGSTSYTSTDTSVTSSSPSTPTSPSLYRSGMYAHWWLKAKIPASVIHQSHPAKTGKLCVIVCCFFRLTG